MKKIIFAIITLVFCISLAACGNQKNDNQKTTITANSEALIDENVGKVEELDDVLIPEPIQTTNGSLIINSGDIQFNKQDGLYHYTGNFTYTSANNNYAYFDAGQLLFAENIKLMKDPMDIVDVNGSVTNGYLTVTAKYDLTLTTLNQHAKIGFSTHFKTPDGNTHLQSVGLVYQKDGNHFNLVYHNDDIQDSN